MSDSFSDLKSEIFREPDAQTLVWNTNKYEKAFTDDEEKLIAAARVNFAAIRTSSEHSLKAASG